jgi:type 2 lantibiotic biosynthesis protein LanM
MGNAESTRVSDVLNTYIPELTSDVIRSRLHRKLLREHGRPASPRADAVAPPPPYDPSLDEDGRFRDYCTHLARSWMGDLPAAVAASPVVAPENTIVRDFVDAQAGVVFRLMLRTLLEELYRRRSAGLLTGGTPQERYRAFREWTNSASGHAELVGRYPGLYGEAARRVRAAAAYLRHVLAELERNRERLSARMPRIPPEAKVRGIEMGMGDTHNGGRSVLRLRFDQGAPVLYKPRPMEAEAGYNAVIRRLNSALGTRLGTIAVLPCDGGGFVEHVRTEPLAIPEEEYFAQIGLLAGVLYLLKATDIHFENVVTCATGPVVVDAETLLTPRLRAAEAAPDDAASWLTAVRRLQDSVLDIGILPTVVKSNRDDPGMDVGVIGYDVGQRVPYQIMRLRNPGRDDMFVELTRAESSDPSANLSTSRATGLPVRAQRDIVKREFRRVLEYARAHADEVAGLIETHLGDARFRYLYNPTYFYTQLLRMATHPDAVTDPLVRAAVLNRVVLRTGDAPEVADEEVRQLAAGDVPYFWYSPRSTALMSGDRVVAADAFTEPALDAVRTRLHRLDAETIEWELRLIDFAFVNKLPTDQERTGFTAPAPSGASGPRVDRARLLSEARRIGDALLRRMIGDPNGRYPATWIAPQVTAVEESQWTPGTLGYDLYAGTPGIALVLAGLARETGESRYGEAALSVLAPLERQIADGELDHLRIAVGGLGGLAGTVYAIVTGRRLLGLPRDAPGHGAGRLLEGLVRRLGPDAEVDHLGGMAGALAVCLALHRHAADPHDRELIEKTARAVAAAELARLRPGRVTAYTGFAHGAMGIGPVLLEYGVRFDDPAARDLGVRVIEAALAAHDPADGDWPREWGGRTRSYAWCHGAPGMLLGALTAVRHAPSAVPEGHLARLAHLTVARGFGNNVTYCHGDLGSAEIVAIAAREVPDLFDRRLVAGLYPRLFADVIERYEERTDNRYTYTNSLMVGQAGLAWSILRHLDPTAYPSVLRFE